ncbi:MAG: hypothetical protein NTV04_06970, partial [Deltaproteobacteria bacterium]|nr:hypothetical protein [Deltaproteobacteria bacterium]
YFLNFLGSLLVLFYGLSPVLHLFKILSHPLPPVALMFSKLRIFSGWPQTAGFSRLRLGAENSHLGKCNIKK